MVCDDGGMSGLPMAREIISCPSAIQSGHFFQFPAEIVLLYLIHNDLLVVYS
jgi:hypothetical protein